MDKLRDVYDKFVTELPDTIEEYVESPTYMDHVAVGDWIDNHSYDVMREQFHRNRREKNFLSFLEKEVSRTIGKYQDEAFEGIPEGCEWDDDAFEWD